MSLSKDMVYPPCPNCDRNANGLFTEKKRLGDWYCIKCRTHFHRDWDTARYAENEAEWRNATGIQP